MKLLSYYILPLSLWLLASTPVFADDTQPLPDLGDQSSALISPQEEQRIGQTFMQDIRKYVTLIDDPVVDDYIQSLGQRLGNYSDNRGFDFSFFVVDDPNINAFAGPAGYIGVHRGLIEATVTESELASVLAHEIAHVTQHHLHRSLENARKMGVPTAAAIIAAILIGATNPSASEALLAASVAGTAQTQLQFSRLHEEEADRVGISLLSQAGYDPRAMPAFFETLQKRTGGGDGGIPEFLSTHPVTENRIADSRNRAEQYPVKQYVNSVEFELLKVRLAFIITKDPNVLLTKYSRALQTGQTGNRFAMQYGLAMAYAATGRLADARNQLMALLKEDRDRSPYLLTLADVETKLNHPDAALKVLANGISLYPTNLNMGIRYAQLLIASDDTGKARQLLREYTHAFPREPEPYQLLSFMEEKAGHLGAAYAYMAEYQFLEGQTQYAIEHLKQALKQKDLDQYERSRIEARLEEYKVEFKRLRNEPEP